MDETIRVLNFLPFADYGGPHNRVLTLAKELEKNGVVTEVLLPRSANGDAKSHFEKAGIMVHEIDYVPPINKLNGRLVCHVLSSITSIPGIVRILKERKIDVIHVNGFYLLPGLIAGKLASVKVLLHLNDIVIPKKIIRILKGLVYGLADTVAASADAVARYYEAVDYEVLYPPVDTAVFDPDNVEAVDLDLPHDFTVGTVANINPAKGLEYFIDAIYELVKEGYDVNGVIVGGVIDTRRDYYDQLKRLVERRGLEGHVFFLGKQSNIPAYLAAFDVFVLSSVREACPITLLEAMAMEKPIVATDVGGVSEMLGGGAGGIIVESKNSKQIFEGIIRYLHCDENIHIKSLQASAIVKKSFFVSKTVKKHIDIYAGMYNVKKEWNSCLTN